VPASVAVQAKLPDLLCASPPGDLETSKPTPIIPANSHLGLIPRPASSLDMTRDITVYLSDMLSFIDFVGTV